MGRRIFGAIKCLLHFDYPYYNEPNDGLDDEIGLETWSKGNTNAALFGSAIPNAGTRAPKFGYRCLRPYTGGIVGTNNTGIWNLNSSRDYEIECFIFGTSTGTRHLLRLCNSSGSEVFTVSITTARTITVLCPDWGITSAVTTESAFTASSWQHILLRISNNSLKVFIQGSEALSQELTPDVTLSVGSVKLGYSSTTTALYIDEFVFRHAAGSSAPAVPTEPYSGVLDISKVGGFGSGSDGDFVISTNTTGLARSTLISSVIDTKTFIMPAAYKIGQFELKRVGREVMIHVTTPIVPNSTTNAEFPLAGLYAFACIEAIDGTTITLDREISTENGYDFTLNNELISSYYVQVIAVPHFTSLTINSGVTLSPYVWSTTSGGGIIAFRCSGDCTINGSIITHGLGVIRHDYQQVTHSKLIDRFLYSQGGGIFIACGGTFSAHSTARLGASWSGAGDGSNGAAGYGGKGGRVNPSSSVSTSGGNGGVGGGGGGAACSSTSSSAQASGGAAGSTGGSATVGGGGGGCGGSGGSGSSYVGGSGGGGQGNSGGTHGTGKTPGSTPSKYENPANGVNGGDYGRWDTNPNSNTSYTFYFSGAGGGAPGGNGGQGSRFKSVSTDDYYPAGGKAGASIILICNKLKVDNAALSTGGEAGETHAFESGYTKIGGSGGGGTGFCYIACNERMSA